MNERRKNDDRDGNSIGHQTRSHCNGKFNTKHGERLNASGDLLEMESTEAWNLLGDQAPRNRTGRVAFDA